MDPNPRPSGGSGDPAVTVDVRECKNLLSSGHRYLDVRTLEEFRNGHPDNALNVPYMFFTPEGRVNNPEFVEKVASLFNKDDFIIVGCQSGARSLTATGDLLKAGFKNVKNMGGGYASWLQNGFDVKIIKDESR